MYESRRHRLAPAGVFYHRVARGLLMGAALVVVSLAIGMVGYHGLERMSWLDAFVAASMILSGMGPTGDLATDAGKLFAGFYAIYCAFALIIIAGVVSAPLLHRFLHRFHLEE